MTTVDRDAVARLGHDPRTYAAWTATTTFSIFMASMTAGVRLGAHRLPRSHCHRDEQAGHGREQDPERSGGGL
jgi:hypothetical protein